MTDFSAPKSTSSSHNLSLDIAYQPPTRPIRRLLLVTTGTTDLGYDDIRVIKEDHKACYNLTDIGIHIYVNSKGEIQWGKSIEKPPEYPTGVNTDDLVILVFGMDTTLNKAVMKTLRALLPVINAFHNNDLIFAGMRKHHAYLGIDRKGKLIEPALQEPPQEIE